MDDEAMGWGNIWRRWRRRGGGKVGVGQCQRGATGVWETTTTMSLPPLVLSEAEALYNSEPMIPFVFRGREAVTTVVDTQSLISPFLPRVIYLSSWDTPPCPFLTVPVPTNTQRPWRQRDSSWDIMGKAGKKIMQ